MEKLNPENFEDYLDSNMRLGELLIIARNTDQLDGITAILDFLVEELKIYIKESEYDDGISNRVQALITDITHPVIFH